MDGKLRRSFVLLSACLLLLSSNRSYSAKSVGGTPSSNSPSSGGTQGQSGGSQNAGQNSQASSSANASSLSVGPNILSYEAQDQIGEDIANEIGQLNSGVFTRLDFLDVSLIAATIEQTPIPPNKADPLTIEIRKYLAPDTKKALHKCLESRANEDVALDLLVRDFNLIVLGPLICDLTRCSPATQARISSLGKALGHTVTKINRLVLEDAFPLAIRKNSFVDAPIKGVLITTYYPNSNNELLLFGYVNSEIKDLQTKFDVESQNFYGGPGAHGFLPQTAADAISAITQLLALFTTATTMSSATVTTNELAIVPALLSDLKKEGIRAEFIDLALDLHFIEKPDSLFARLKAVAVQRAQAQTLLDKNRAKIPDPKDSTKMIDNPNYGNLLPYQIQALDGLSTTCLAYDSFYTNIIMTNISGLLAADYYNVEVVNNTGNVLLVLKSLYAGGDSRIKSNPFVNLFTDGPRFSYIGGAATAFLVIDGSGAVIASRNVRNFVGFKKLGNSEDYHTHNNLLTPALSR